MSDTEKQENVVTFTAAEWRSEESSEAFGVRKVVPKKKEPTPGMKAVLVFDDSFREAKKQLKKFPAFRPQLDLPELLSAMIDVCCADPAVMEKVTRRIIEMRKQQLAALEAGTAQATAP
ncbi:hypothetical protein DF047_35520 [Burkholderia cenocepacia]|jgi:hypothetical protein|uniref:hypothetical protein n=1 Tax=Burkholderia TaxID=32008 RepID=UPI000F5BA30E|nr:MULTISPECIES: hypothetical protein [Burkholderia]MBW5287784.1 hypothetical protein [Burkholderia gladioli]MDR8093060.1 hypothetical protein [Burkholderia gladioli]RQU99166.1 hypothetical protein DF047_35520 [Burkholderia cenocepacia]